MRKILQNVLVTVLCFVLVLSCTSCGEKCPCTINGIGLNQFSIVYSNTEGEYNLRAAEYLRDEILAKTGIELQITEASESSKSAKHEIVIGETNREISAQLDAKTENVQFSMLADKNHVALEGDFFVIAAAAYYFVETYITGAEFEATIAKEETVLDPITKDAKNYIFLIGDGMGPNQTTLFDVMTPTELKIPSDGEDEFYGYMFPNLGFSRTDSLTGTTDSAAGGTALSTGYKTTNGYLGKKSNKEDVESLTEIASKLGKSTAVMSTEVLTGATPASFSVHISNRNEKDAIAVAQLKTTMTYGTRFVGSYGSSYTQETFDKVKKDIKDTLGKLSENEKGFFLMYEEAYIDKHCHSNDLSKTFSALVRFNQAIGAFMEYAFYNPETFVLITADHETGGLTIGEDGTYSYTVGDHTSKDVPVFTYGKGSQIFNGITVENIQIPKTIAKMWGVELEGYKNQLYPALDLA